MWCSFAVERKIDAVMEQRLALHARADAGRDQQIDHPLLDQSGTNARFAIVAAARLDDDAFDAGEVQEMRQHQPRWARAHDPDLRPHVLPWSFLFVTPVLGGVIDSSEGTLAGTNGTFPGYPERDQAKWKPVRRPGARQP